MFVDFRMSTDIEKICSAIAEIKESVDPLKEDVDNLNPIAKKALATFGRERGRGALFAKASPLPRAAQRAYIPHRVQFVME